jgi:hypothetical protein
MFRELAMACGTTEIEAETIYQAVHLFGADAYANDQKNTQIAHGDEVAGSELTTNSEIPPSA